MYVSSSVEDTTILFSIELMIYIIIIFLFIVIWVYT